MSVDPDKDTACPKDDLLVNTGCEESSQSDTDILKKTGRSVCFPDDDELVTQYFEPANPWQDVPHTTRAQLAAEYLDSCRRHNTMPIDTVLQQIRELPENSIGGGNRASRLLLADCCLNGAAPTDALEALLSKVQFRRVEIDHAEIDDEAAEALFDMIEYYESAVVVSITGPRQFGIRGWQAVSRLIRKSGAVREVEVSLGAVLGAHAHVVARALRPPACALRALCLHRAQLSGDALLTLVLVLKTNMSVRELRLPDNELMPSDAQQLATLLRFNNNIQLLDLSNNSIQDQGVAYISDALVSQAAQTPPSAAASPLSPHHYPLGLQDSRGLAVLVLWNNQLTKHCAPYLSRALRSSHSLCVLNIGRNRLEAETAGALPRGVALVSLGLQCSALGRDAAGPLAALLRHNTLQRLDLRDNDLGVVGLQAILDAMRENTTLTQIDLDDPEESTNLSENSELATISRLTREIRAACRRNEPPACEPEKRVHRKISLTCHTNIRHKNGCSESVRGPRLRSPAPSPAPSPAGSPVPSHANNNRFSVTRVTPERESSGESVSPSTPTRPTYCSTPSRFKVMQVVEPPQIQVHPAQKRSSSRFSVTRNYDSIYNPSPTPSVSPVPVSPTSQSPVMTSQSPDMTSRSPVMTARLPEILTDVSISQSVMTKSPVISQSSEVFSDSCIVTQPSIITLTNEIMTSASLSSVTTLSDSRSVMTERGMQFLDKSLKEEGVMTILPPVATNVTESSTPETNSGIFDHFSVSVPEMVDTLEKNQETKTGTNVSPISISGTQTNVDSSHEKLISESGTKSSEIATKSSEFETKLSDTFIEITGTCEIIRKDRLSDVIHPKKEVDKVKDEAKIVTKIEANELISNYQFDSRFGPATKPSDCTLIVVPHTRFSISPIPPDNDYSTESIDSEIARPIAMGSQINVAIGGKVNKNYEQKEIDINPKENKKAKGHATEIAPIKDFNTQTIEESDISKFVDKKDKENKSTVTEYSQRQCEDKIFTKDEKETKIKESNDFEKISIDKVVTDTFKEVKNDVRNKTYSDVVKSDTKYKDNVEQLTHSEEISDILVKTETKLVKNSVKVSDNEKIDVQVSVKVVKESLKDEKCDKNIESIKKDKTTKQIEEITEDIGNLIKEIKDISSKTKKKCTVDIKDNIVPGINRDVILKKNKSESSLDSPDLEVSRLMNKKLIGSPFCDSSSSLEISGSSMESLYTEGQNPPIQRPIVIQESVESDSELDRRKDVVLSTESSMENDVTPVNNFLNMSVSSNESVSPIIFGKKKKIHDSLSSLEASMSSIESNRQEKVMVTSADSGIEYSLQQQTEDTSNEGTLTHNSSLIETVKKDQDTLTSPKRTSSLLDVPALKTKGLDRMRKISWVAPSSSFHIPRVEMEKDKPSHLEKLLSLFQHPTSIFSRSQSEEERKSASNTPPRKDSSLTSSFWSWGSTIEKEKDDKEDSSEATDSTLSERVQVSFVDESFSKKLDKTPSTDTENTLSEIQNDDKRVTDCTTDVLVQKCSLTSIVTGEEKASDNTDLSKPNENKIDDDKSESKEVKIEAIRPRSFAAVLKSSGSENSLDKQPSPDSGQPVDKLPSKVIRGIKENISPENTLTSSINNIILATELIEKQVKSQVVGSDKNETRPDENKSDLAPIATIEETCDEAADNTVNIPLEFIDDVKLTEDLVVYGPEPEPKQIEVSQLENVDFGKDALSYLIYENQEHNIEKADSLAQELKDAEKKEMDLSPELVIDAIEIPEVLEMKGVKSPVIPERAKLKKSNSLEDLTQRPSVAIEKNPKAKTIAFKIPETTSPRDIPERRPKLRTMSGSSPKSLPESLNKPSPLSKIDSVLRKRKRVSSLGKMAKDSLLALNMSEEEIAEYRRSYVTSVESLRSLESVSEDANSQSGTSVDSRCRACLRTSQESLMSLDSITEDCRCGADSDKPRSAR